MTTGILQLKNKCIVSSCVFTVLLLCSVECKSETFPWNRWNLTSLEQNILSIVGKREIALNPFPHTTILQQTTLNIFCQIMENLYNSMDNLWLKVENIVTKGEIARFVQFLLLLLYFQKAVCCRGVRKRLYEGKG